MKNHLWPVIQLKASFIHHYQSQQRLQTQSKKSVPTENQSIAINCYVQGDLVTKTKKSTVSC